MIGDQNKKFLFQSNEKIGSKREINQKNEKNDLRSNSDPFFSSLIFHRLENENGNGNTKKEVLPPLLSFPSFSPPSSRSLSSLFIIIFISFFSSFESLLLLYLFSYYLFY